MLRRLVQISLFCGLVAFIAACGSSNKNQGPQFNTPILYNPTSSSIHPKIGIHHISNNESQLFVMIDTNELLVSEANPEGTPRADVKIRYELYDCTDIANNKLISDSSTFINFVEIRQQQRIVVFPITIPAEQGRRYMLLVQTSDLQRRNTIRQFMTVNKTSIHSGQNFKLTTVNGSPKLENTIRNNEIFRIEYRRRPIDKLFIKYKNISQPLATAPTALAAIDKLEFEPDSIWEQAYSPNTNFMFGYEGLYLIQSDTTQQEGLLLMNFGNTFPFENRTAQMVLPIQYILTDVEFQRLTQQGWEEPKRMMDHFWLSATGSTDRARMMIRVFYTRMSYANRYFTDFKEGWKTDRGMIYMIYGLPNNIHKGSDSETWEYVRRQRADPLTFVFERHPSNYTEEYFVLRRGDAQPTFWRQAIDSWRRGRIFSINDMD